MDNNVRWPVDLLHSVAVPPRWRLPGVLPQYGLVDEDNAGNRYEMLVRNGGFITLRVLHNWQEVASAESDYMSNGHFAMCHDWNGTGMCVYNHGYDLRVFWSDSEDVRVEGATPPLGVACAYDNGVWYVFNQCAYGVEVWVSTGDGFSLGLSGDDSGPCKDLTFSGAVLMGAFVYRVAGQAKVCLMWLRPTWDGRWEWVRVDSNYKDIDARSSEDTASVSSSLGALYVAGERYTGTTELTSRVGTEGVDTQAEVFRPFLSRCEVESVGFIVSETTAVASVMDTTCDTFDRYSADTSYVTQQTGYWLLAPYVTSGSSFPILRYLGLMPNVLDITISMLFDSVSGTPAVLYIDLSDGIRLRVSSFYGIFGPSGNIHQLSVFAVRGYTVLSSAYGSLGTGQAEPAWLKIRFTDNELSVTVMTAAGVVLSLNVIKTAEDQNWDLSRRFDVTYISPTSIGSRVRIGAIGSSVPPSLHITSNRASDVDGWAVDSVVADVDWIQVSGTSDTVIRGEYMCNTYTDDETIAGRTVTVYQPPVSTLNEIVGVFSMSESAWKSVSDTGRVTSSLRHISMS